MSNPGQFRLGDPYRPLAAVWELTMRCDHACAHCGSRARSARPSELDTTELLEVAAALVRLGCQEVTLIGGEAYLHPGALELTRALSEAGVRVVTQTGGRGFTAGLARRWREAGLFGVGVSVDGPEDAHDLLRASPGSFQAAISALHHAREAGLLTGVNTQVNRVNHQRLPETLAALQPTGIRSWRAQLTAPMGRAADQPGWILEPYQILAVIDTLARLQLELAREARAQGRPWSEVLDVQLGNNLGYYGPHETVLRSRPGGEASYYPGCVAGLYVLGIESDGKIKGCPSLPTAPYVGGNVRDTSLERIWAETAELRFARERDRSELWGFCATCTYAEVCRGGCSFTAHTTLGRRGNNLFCSATGIRSPRPSGPPS